MKQDHSGFLLRPLLIAAGKRPGQVLAGHPPSPPLKDRAGLPISHHARIILNIKLKTHIGTPGHTHRLHGISKTPTNGGKTHLTAWLSVFRSPMGGLCSGGGPLWRVMAVDCIQYKRDCTAPSSVRQVEHSAPWPSPPRK